MSGVIDMVHAYQALVARTERLRIPLDPSERQRLVRLERGLGLGDGEGTRRMPRVLCPWPVMLTLPGGFARGRLRDLSGGGMRVHAAAPPPEGTPVLVHVQGQLRGEEFTFPTRVVWRRLGEEPAMGLAFDGVPSHVEPEAGEGRRRRHTPLVA